MTQGGYIAIDRRLFEHPMFRHRENWLAAWQKLIADAAWKPTGVRTRFGIVEVGRGEIATTIRELAAAWGWAKSSVDYFLTRLADEKMILVKSVRTVRRTVCGPSNSHRVTVITICNYDKFQTSSALSTKRRAHSDGHSVGQLQPELPGIVAQKTSEPSNQSNQRQQEEVKSEGGFKRSAGGRRAHCPPDGATTETLLFARTGGEYWSMYAADYREFTGTEPFPTPYDDGFSGRWFWRNGEATRPRRRQAKRA